MSTNEPFGKPRGTVRAILVLELVTAVVAIAIAVTLRVLLDTSGDFSPREAFLITWGTLGQLVSVAVGYYFGTRPTSGPAAE